MQEDEKEILLIPPKVLRQIMHGTAVRLIIKYRHRGCEGPRIRLEEAVRNAWQRACKMACDKDIREKNARNSLRFFISSRECGEELAEALIDDIWRKAKKHVANE